MGYRSDVYISTTNDGFLRMRELGEGLEIERPEFKLLSLSRGPEVVDSDSRGTVFGWTWVKWYDSYKAVEEVHKILDIASDEGVPWQFVRMGEDLDDIEKEFSVNMCCPRHLRIAVDWD